MPSFEEIQDIVCDTLQGKLNNYLEEFTAVMKEELQWDEDEPRDSQVHKIQNRVELRRVEIGGLGKSASEELEKMFKRTSDTRVARAWKGWKEETLYETVVKFHQYLNDAGGSIEVVWQDSYMLDDGIKKLQQGKVDVEKAISRARIRPVVSD